MLNNYFAHETAVIDEGAMIGDQSKIWHFCHVMSGAKIGQRCILGQNVMIAGNVVVGDGVKIQNNVSVYEGVLIERNAFIGPSVVFTNVSTPRSFVNRKDKFLITKVGEGASIGANATIICGNSIGNFAMVGAGSVVTKNVLPYALVVGNPAKQVGWVSEFGRTLNFNVGDIALCPETKEAYQLKNNQIIKVNTSNTNES